jgi:hypothetical protein
MSIEIHTNRRHRKVAGVPVDQLHTKLTLKFTDATTELRGRDTADPACTGESPGLDHERKQRQIIENDSHTPSGNRCKYGKKSRKNSE